MSNKLNIIFLSLLILIQPATLYSMKNFKSSFLATQISNAGKRLQKIYNQDKLFNTFFIGSVIAIDYYKAGSTLNLAASYGYGFTWLVKLLVNMGANVNEENKYGCSALHLAIMRDDPEIVGLLY